MRIRAKKGYNININDIGVSLQNGADFVEIDDETYKNSADIKKVADLIEIDNKNSKKVRAKAQDLGVKPIKKAPGAFVMQTGDQQKVSDAVVFDPNNEANAKIKVKEVMKKEPAKIVQAESEQKTTHNYEDASVSSVDDSVNETVSEKIVNEKVINEKPVNETNSKDASNENSSDENSSDKDASVDKQTVEGPAAQEVVAEAKEDKDIDIMNNFNTDVLKQEPKKRGRKAKKDK